MRLLDAIKSAADILEKAGVEDPLADAEIMVLHAAGADRLAAYTDNPQIGANLLSKIRRYVVRRAKGEPLQYITGYVEFCGLAIKVGKGTLIPRPETELLVEYAIDMLRGLRPETTTGGRSSDDTPQLPPAILDLCTGSGCIALALAREFPEAEVTGTDISGAALRYAKKNAALNGIGNATFVKGPLFAPVRKTPGFDLITANPPYISTAEISGLQREIREWEPMNALEGGVDGLDFYREIFSEAGVYLRTGGAVIVELGAGQAADVAKIAEKCGFAGIEIRKDYAGIDRILKAEKQ